uniref:Fluorescent protein 8 n=1 Tax=Olindias formosus TaxID=1495449 RepID=A0A5A4MJX1_9CNID|nr:fluorescent protein 8 [Olindias formosus]
MEGGPALFTKPMNHKTEITGEFNGKCFKVVGHGSAPGGGDFTMHAYCESGTLPVSWCVLSPSIQYGFSMFTKYPNGITNFFQEAFPEGYTLDRVMTRENGGTVVSHHSYDLGKDGIVAKVSVKGEGFDPNGPTMTKGYVKVLPFICHLFPHGAGVRMLASAGMVTTDGSIDIFNVDSNFQPVGSRKVRVPKFHFVQHQIILMKDASDTRDHVVMREVAVAQDPNEVQSALRIA